jgi:hypothetical protein
MIPYINFTISYKTKLTINGIPDITSFRITNFFLVIFSVPYNIDTQLSTIEIAISEYDEITSKAGNSKTIKEMA